MRKFTKRIVIGLALIVLLLLVAACAILSGDRAFQKEIALDPALEYEISIKDYRSGTHISVTEADDQRAILQAVSTTQYKGITGSHSMDGQMSAYSLILSSAEHQSVFIITEDTSAIISTPLRLRIDAPDLYDCVHDLFSQYTHAGEIP